LSKWILLSSSAQFSVFAKAQKDACGIWDVGDGAKPSTQACPNSRLKVRTTNKGNIDMSGFLEEKMGYCHRRPSSEANRRCNMLTRPT